MFCMASNIFLCVFFPFNFSPILLTLVATLYLCEYFLYKKFVFLTKMNIGSATGNCTKQHPHGFRNSEYLDWHEIGCCTKIICFHTQIPKQCNWQSKMDKIRQNLCHLDKKVFSKMKLCGKIGTSCQISGKPMSMTRNLVFSFTDIGHSPFHPIYCCAAIINMCGLCSSTLPAYNIKWKPGQQP